MNMAFIQGTNGNDNLNGTSASDTLIGLFGDDNLFGGFLGDDIFDGGRGRDTVSYQGFSNNINASLETNKATFLRGSGTFIDIENLIGGNNSDTLTGNRDNNRIDGSFGNDEISGREGNDFLIGGAGNDTMIGGSGDDTFEWVDGDGSDLIAGDGGRDNLLFNGSIAQGDHLEVSQSGSNIVLQRTNLLPITLTTTGIESFNAINGGGGDDVLSVRNLGATSGVQIIQFTGGDGNDFLRTGNTSTNIDASGGNGNDFFLSGNGNDTLSGERGNDFISGRDGNDIIKGAESTNLGRGEIDILTGEAGQDTFVLDNFYDDGNIFTDGTGDFARISDFKVGEDLIQLSGPRSNYQLKPITNSLQSGSAAIQDMGIFKNNKPGSIGPLELIAIVQDAPSGLNLNDTRQFIFS
jgi:Ca2+-binding RTX toxin-like protein